VLLVLQPQVQADAVVKGMITEVIDKLKCQSNIIWNPYEPCIETAGVASRAEVLRMMAAQLTRMNPALVSPDPEVFNIPKLSVFHSEFEEL
jgi:hypothetical protein